MLALNHHMPMLHKSFPNVLHGKNQQYGHHILEDTTYVNHHALQFSIVILILSRAGSAGLEAFAYIHHDLAAISSWSVLSQ